MSHLSLHGDGNFGPQPVQRDGKKYSDRGAGVGGGVAAGRWSRTCHGEQLTGRGGSPLFHGKKTYTQGSLETVVLPPTLAVKQRLCLKSGVRVLPGSGVFLPLSPLQHRSCLSERPPGSPGAA